MNSSTNRLKMLLLQAGVFLLAPLRSHGTIGLALSDFERALANLQGNTNLNLTEIRQAISNALQTIEGGRDLTNRMTAQIATLGQEKAKLEKTKESLENARLLLGTGFLAAVLGALVGFLQKRNSKAERILKELEVVEKIAKLKAAQIAVPSDIEKQYAPKQA